MTIVRLRGTKPGIPGQITAVVIVQSSELGTVFELEIKLKDRGDRKLNREEARTSLERFAKALAEAARHPLRCEESPAAANWFSARKTLDAPTPM
jgi:hypothetical protein